MRGRCPADRITNYRVSVPEPWAYYSFSSYTNVLGNDSNGGVVALDFIVAMFLGGLFYVLINKAIRRFSKKPEVQKSSKFSKKRKRKR